MLKIKNTITEMKNVSNSIISSTRTRSSELEYRWIEISQTEIQREKIWEKKGQNIQELWDNFNRYNMYIIGKPEGEEKENGVEDMFEVLMAKNYPNQW